MQLAQHTLENFSNEQKLQHRKEISEKFCLLQLFESRRKLKSTLFQLQVVQNRRKTQQYFFFSKLNSKLKYDKDDARVVKRKASRKIREVEWPFLTLYSD